MTAVSWTWKQRPGLTSVLIVPETEEPQNAAKYCLLSGQEQACSRITCFSSPCTPIQKRKKRYKVLSQNLHKPSQHSCSVVKVLNSASEMKILRYVTDLWTMKITFYKEKLNPLSFYACLGQTEECWLPKIDLCYDFGSLLYTCLDRCACPNSLIHKKM